MASLKADDATRVSGGLPALVAPGGILPDGEVLKQEPLVQDDYNRIKSVLATSPAHYPYLLAVKVLRNSGIREAELLRCCPEHLVRRGPTLCLLVRRGKQRGQPRWEYIPLEHELGAQLLAYSQGKDTRPQHRIFPFTARSLQRVFLAASMEVTGLRYTPHQLRHLYVKTLRDGHVDLERAAKLVGHSDSRTTQRVYDDITFEEREVVSQWMPT